MNNEKFYEKYKYEVDELADDDYDTIDDKVEYFVECFDVKDCFYLDNLTNKHEIAKRAEKNLLKNLAIEVLDVKSINTILSITNLSSIGIVEYIANDEFDVKDNEIVTFEEVEKLNEKEMKATIELYEYLDLDKNSIEEDYDNDFLTISEGRDNQLYAFYIEEDKACAINIDTLAIISDNAKLDELFA